MQEIKARIHAFLKKFFQHDIQDDQDIFAQGFVNSLFAMQLIMFIESEFALHIEDHELDISNFKTINDMSALIVQKQGKM